MREAGYEIEGNVVPLNVQNLKEIMYCLGGLEKRNVR